MALTNLYITGNPIDIIEIHVFDNHNNIKDLFVDCSNCFDCDRLSISTCKWITKRVTDLRSYSFTCRNGVNLPNTVLNCSDDESSLAVTRIQNETSCNCNESSSIKSSSLEITTDTHPAMESTIDKVQHTTKTKANLTDTEHNSTINDGIDVIKTINYNGQMDKKYYNIPPKSHMNTLYNGIDVSKNLNCNKQMDKEGYNNIPPECHMNRINGDIDVIKTLKCN
ncbi:unnamed protein product [Mytilus edulis]|uniref:Uncharacterized protein n=1 Tax=Mytilus edulis TaxID=6550 RepID=A0A8S3UWE0_MYTED|nr:unnamed protein product [Mytilus edulis]